MSFVASVQNLDLGVVANLASVKAQLGALGNNWTVERPFVAPKHRFPSLEAASGMEILWVNLSAPPFAGILVQINAATDKEAASSSSASARKEVVGGTNKEKTVGTEDSRFALHNALNSLSTSVRSPKLVYSRAKFETQMLLTWNDRAQLNANA